MEETTPVVPTPVTPEVESEVVLTPTPEEVSEPDAEETTTA